MSSLVACELFPEFACLLRRFVHPTRGIRVDLRGGLDNSCTFLGKVFARPQCEFAKPFQGSLACCEGSRSLLENSRTLSIGSRARAEGSLNSVAGLLHLPGGPRSLSLLKGFLIPRKGFAWGHRGGTCLRAPAGPHTVPGEVRGASWVTTYCRIFAGQSCCLAWGVLTSPSLCEEPTREAHFTNWWPSWVPQGNLRGDQKPRTSF